MRVTHKMLSSIFLYDLDRNRVDLSGLQTRIATAKRINRPSDDPAGVERVLRLRSSVKRLEGYKENVDEAKDWMESTELALRDTWQVFSEAKMVLLRAMDGSTDAQARKAMACGIDQLLEGLIRTANSRKEGRYIFGGTETLTAPYTASYKVDEKFRAAYDTPVPLGHARIEEGSVVVTDGTNTYTEGVDYTLDYERGTITVLSSGDMSDGTEYYVSYRTREVSSVSENPKGISGKMYRAVGEGLRVQVNMPGSEVFGGEPDAFRALIRVRDSLVRDDREGIKEALSDVDEILDRLDARLAELGTRMERVEATGELLEREKVEVQGLLNMVESTDIARAVMELQLQEMVYLAALEVGSRVLQPSLVDFLGT